MRERLFPALFVLLWATGFIGARYAMPWCEPFLFLAARFFIACAVLAAIAIMSKAKWPDRAVAIHAAIAGALIHGVYLACVFWAIRNGLPAGMSALIVGIQPLVTALIAGRVLQEKITPQHWLGLAIGLIGIALVLSPKLNLAGTGVNAATLTASFVSVIGIAAGTIWQKRFVTGADLRTSTSLQYLGATLLAGGLTLAFEKQEFVLYRRVGFRHGLAGSCVVDRSDLSFDDPDPRWRCFQDRVSILSRPLGHRADGLAAVWRNAERSPDFRNAGDSRGRGARHTSGLHFFPRVQITPDGSV